MRLFGQFSGYEEMKFEPEKIDVVEGEDSGTAANEEMEVEPEKIDVVEVEDSETAANEEMEDSYEPWQ